MFKNVASQKVIVFAWDNAAGEPKTGDAANITARISKEGVDSAASNDVNPTEISATTHKGLYKFNILTVETNCDLFGLTAVSSTADIDLQPVIIYTTTVMRGTDSAALAAVCTAARLAELDAANLPAAVDTVNTDLSNATDGLGALKTAIEAVFTTQLTESYAADGVAPTPAQALMLIQQVLTEFAIVTTALTIKKLDGSTTAAVLTLDDATNPTSAARTS